MNRDFERPDCGPDYENPSPYRRSRSDRARSQPDGAPPPPAGWRRRLTDVGWVVWLGVLLVVLGPVFWAQDVIARWRERGGR
jgi:hypothetical protein